MFKLPSIGMEFQGQAGFPFPRLLEHSPRESMMIISRRARHCYRLDAIVYVRK